MRGLELAVWHQGEEATLGSLPSRLAASSTGLTCETTASRVVLMNDSNQLDIAAVQEQLRAFTSDRAWEQFHSPKNLAMALAAEVGELLEILQWLSEEQSHRLSESDLARVEEEIADIQIYLLRMVDVLGISLPSAVEAKIRSNALKYPVELSRGNATKSSRRDEG